MARVADIDALGDLARYYETGAYKPGKPRLEMLARPLLRVFDRQRIRILRKLVPPGGTVLDVGAGRGRFLESLVRAGFDGRGIEPSERGYLACRDRGLDVGRCGIENATVAPSSLDAVVLWHVLEHVPDPRAALERIHGWLKPGGVLLVGVPNLDSFQAWIGGERWLHLDLPRHLNHFTVRSMKVVLSRSGFTPRSIDHTLLEHNQLGMYQTILNRFTPTPNFLYFALKRNLGRRRRYIVDAVVTVLLALPVGLLAVALEWFAGAVGRGGAITVESVAVPVQTPRATDATETSTAP